MNDRLASFYEEKYGGTAGTCIGNEPTRLTNPRNRYEAVLSYFVPCESVLAVGAGDGMELLALRSMCTAITATEISPSRASLIKETFTNDPGVMVELHNIEDGPGPLEGKAYDAIILNAVVEHLIDPIGALSIVRNLIAPGGYLLITTPNIAKWTRRIKLAFGRFPGTASVDEGLLQYDGVTATALYDEGHLHYFTNRSLTRILLERTGFSRVDRLSYGRPAVLARAWPTLFSDVCLRAYA